MRLLCGGEARSIRSAIEQFSIYWAAFARYVSGESIKILSGRTSHRCVMRSEMNRLMSYGDVATIQPDGTMK